VSPVRGKVEVLDEFRSWADVARRHKRRRTEDWKTLCWKEYQRNVYRLQKRICRAARQGDGKRVHKLQRLLLRSWSARCLAVRQVSQDNRGKRTAGVDGVKNLTPKQRLRLARELDGYEAKLSLEEVPGGRGQLIVLATDGLRSSFAISDPFKIEDKPPEIWITSPRDGTVFPPDQPLSLIGQAVDILGSKLPEDGLVWEVDGRTIQQGTGIAPAVGLKPGYHETSLSFRYGDDVAARSTVKFSIAEYNEAQLRYRQVMGLDS
jgi:hypothetical protein